jgi:predicted RNA-binding protein with PIN domain
MHLLIDGHNLIGAQVFADIRLADEDDEAKLVARLKVWKSRIKGKITVIFDRGIPGGIDIKMGGAGVEVIFAADPAEADDLIRRRLRHGIQGLTLVTNDDALVREATSRKVPVWRGAEFVQRMTLRGKVAPEAGAESDIQVSAAEVDEWLALFEAAQPKRKDVAKRKPTTPPQLPAQRDGQKPTPPKRKPRSP